jgi:hypothetical protein
VELPVTSRARFASLLPVLIFIALRSLSHANPAPLPWTSGVFDGDGLDDILQTVRISYATSSDLRHVVPAVRGNPTGHIAAGTPVLAGTVFVATAHSRAPPRA